MDRLLKNKECGEMKTYRTKDEAPVTLRNESNVSDAASGAKHCLYRK